jgi:Nuclease-related domain
MSTLTVVRWRKYGKDRLYVSDDAGSRIGWVDLLSASSTIEDQSRATEFHEAVAHWYQSSERMSGRPGPVATPAAAATQPRTPVRPSPPNHVGPAAPVTPHEHCIDLAENRPGQAAREQADAELAAMRERSRIGSFLARAFDMKTDERSWRVGAGGEETVGARLEKLRKHGWHILHAVPVGERGSDIDHVVIGPGGVYTLNTKTHPGGNIWVGKHSVLVNGRKQPTCATRASRVSGRAAC